MCTAGCAFVLDEFKNLAPGSAYIQRTMSLLSLGQYFGRTPERWTADAIALSPVIHDAPRANVSHAHEAAFVTLLLEGEYAETAATRSHRFERFTAIYHPAGLEHRDVVGGSGVRLLIFEFGSELVDGEPFRDRRSLRELSGSREAWELLSLYLDSRSGHDPLAFESRALSLVARIARLPIPRDLPPLLRARDFVHAHFREQLLMKAIAAAAGLHPVYLGQMFRRQFGETIASYVARLRVRAAAEQLATTDTPFAAVALDHGFCDQSHFHRTFRKLTGATPASFRRVLHG